MDLDPPEQGLAYFQRARRRRLKGLPLTTSQKLAVLGYSHCHAFHNVHAVYDTCGGFVGYMNALEANKFITPLLETTNAQCQECRDHRP